MDIGVNSEYGKLKSVLLHIPTEQSFNFNTAKDVMFVKKPIYSSIIKQIHQYVELLESLGITVYTDECFDGRYEAAHKYPNLIYMKDLAVITHNKIILANPLHKIRQGEEKYLQDLLIFLGVKQEQIIVPDTTEPFEGADVLWLHKDEILINYGYRTSLEAAKWLKDYFVHNDNIKPEKIHFIEGNKTHRIPQHIQGSKCIFSNDKLAIRRKLNSETFDFNNVIKFDENEEIVNKYSLNVITTNKDEIVMPSNCYNTKKKYEELNIKCYESPMDEITLGAGGFACMTLYLNREFI